VRIPFDLDPRIEAWLCFFGVSIEDSLNEAGSAMISEGSLYYHLASAAVECGVTPPDLSKTTSAEYEGINPKFVAFPDLSILQNHRDVPQPESLESLSSKAKKSRNDERSEKVRDLLAISHARLRESGSKVVELIPFNVTEETESVSGGNSPEQEQS
jgi:hypothetical protein